MSQKEVDWATQCIMRDATSASPADATTTLQIFLQHSIFEITFSEITRAMVATLALH